MRLLDLERPSHPVQTSVIIPTFNRVAQLRECLHALARQTCTDFQAIVINDGGEAVEPALAEFPQLPLELINQPIQRGQVAARNRGLEIARGRYIAFCDDDDLWLPTHLSRLVQPALAGGGLVHSDAEIVVFAAGPNGRVPAKREPFAFQDDVELLRHWNFIPPSTALYPREAHDALGTLDEEMHDYWDWDWWLRLISRYPLVRVPVASVLVAVDAQGQNASANLASMTPHLARLTAKHGLGHLPTSNFALMVREPSLQSWRRESQMIWDGLMPPGVAN